MSEHGLTFGNTSTGIAPAAVRPPLYPHELRYEKPAVAARTGP
ncbi:hypothetical protein ACGFNX_06350 [Streptomyces sp. NPDC048723]